MISQATALRLHFVGLLALCPIAVIGVIACAANGSFTWSFASAVILILASFRASYVWDCMAEERRWEEATEHPKI